MPQTAFLRYPFMATVATHFLLGAQDENRGRADIVKEKDNCSTYTKARHKHFDLLGRGGLVPFAMYLHGRL